MKRTVIKGTGHYIPEIIRKNSDYIKEDFYDAEGKPYPNSNEEIVVKFHAITHIEERRYVREDQNCSDIATIACRQAIEDANVDPETIDYIIGATNFADIDPGDTHIQTMPSVAAKVKHNLRIKNPKMVAYDILFGCPGWVEAMIQAHAFIKAGMANRVLVFGAEVLSRAVDPNDRDSMIFADGAGAVLVEAVETDEEIGILSHNTLTLTYDEAHFIHNGKTFHPTDKRNAIYIKMQGRKIYEFALINVPKAIKETIELAGLDIHDIKKVLIHQANEKMDLAIIKRLLRAYKIKEVPDGFMPMTIAKLGNTSVATVPTMLSLIMKKELGNHELNEGDTVVMTSVGAGMHINAFVYRF